MPTPFNISATTAVNRRRLLAGFALTAGALVMPRRFVAAQAMQQVPTNPENKKLTSLHHEIAVKASPQRIYAALLDAKQFSTFSGLPAEIDPKEGGAFSLFQAQIAGRNIELVANQRIVQAWRPAHWDAGIYSIARFQLNPSATGTAIVFDHTGFPAGEFDHLDWGWHNHYWEPLQKFLT